MSIQLITRLRGGVTRKASTGAVSYAVTQLRGLPTYVCVWVCVGVCACAHACVRHVCVTA